MKKLEEKNLKEKVERIGCSLSARWRLSAHSRLSPHCRLSPYCRLSAHKAREEAQRRA